MSRRLTPPERRLIRLAWEAGANLDQIAMLVGRALSTVRQHLHAMGCYRHGSRYAPDRATQPRTDSPMASLAREAARRRPRFVYNRHAA